MTIAAGRTTCFSMMERAAGNCRRVWAAAADVVDGIIALSVCIDFSLIDSESRMNIQVIGKDNSWLSMRKWGNSPSRKRAMLNVDWKSRWSTSSKLTYKRVRAFYINLKYSTNIFSKDLATLSAKLKTNTSELWTELKWKLQKNQWELIFPDSWFNKDLSWKSEKHRQKILVIPSFIVFDLSVIAAVKLPSPSSSWLPDDVVVFRRFFEAGV